MKNIFELEVDFLTDKDCTEEDVVVAIMNAMSEFDEFGSTLISPSKNPIQQDIEVPYGTLTKPFGLNGFNKADIGHQVFASRDRYIIYLTSDTHPTTKIPFYKETLEPFIEKQKPISGAYS